jgi:hypothetical protein
MKVASDRALARVLQSEEATGWISQWAVEIRQYHVDFVPRWAIKSQVLIDFIIESTDSSMRGKNVLPDHWVIYFNGSYTSEGPGLVSY